MNKYLDKRVEVWDTARMKSEKIPRSQWRTYSVPLSEHEKSVIDNYVALEGMKLGEFLRRAALAYIEAHDRRK